MILRDEQISGAIAVVIAGDDGARIFEGDLVEADFGGNIVEAVRAKITEQPHFATPIFSFSDCYQINPAVIVVVDGAMPHARTQLVIGNGTDSNSWLDCCARAL